MAHHDISHSTAGHEQDRTPVGAIVKFGLGLGLLMIATLWGLAALFRAWTTRDTSASPASGIRRELVLPRPRLQASPKRDLDELRQAEDKALNSYGWIDRDAGQVRIPIDRAMELMVQRGLPFRAAGAQPAASGKGVGKK